MLLLIIIIGIAVLINHYGWERITDFLGLSENTPPAPPPAEGAVQVHFIDVGQGSATLIISEERSVLIDTGDRRYYSRLIGYIRRMGIERLCLIITTHPHADHIGGVDRVISRIGTDRLMKPQIAEQFRPTTATYGRKLDAVERYGVPVVYSTVGYVFWLSDSAFIEILAPYDCFGNNVNNHSIIARLVHGDNSFLFTGDVERDGEDCLIYRRVNLSANVLKVSHHGSRTSSQRAFLEAVTQNIFPYNDLYAVISVGSPNRYNHPTDEVLNRLDVMGFDILRTDTHGHIVFTSTVDGVELVYSDE